jgi:hypothetical protein
MPAVLPDGRLERPRFTTAPAGETELLLDRWL